MCVSMKVPRKEIHARCHAIPLPEKTTDVACHCLKMLVRLSSSAYVKPICKVLFKAINVLHGEPDFPSVCLDSLDVFRITLGLFKWLLLEFL